MKNKDELRCYYSKALTSVKAILISFAQELLWFEDLLKEKLLNFDKFSIEEIDRIYDLKEILARINKVYFMQLILLRNKPYIIEDGHGGISINYEVKVLDDDVYDTVIQMDTYIKLINEYYNDQAQIVFNNIYLLNKNFKFDFKSNTAWDGALRKIVDNIENIINKINYEITTSDFNQIEDSIKEGKEYKFTFVQNRCAVASFDEETYLKFQQLLVAFESYLKSSELLCILNIITGSVEFQSIINMEEDEDEPKVN